MKLSIKTIEILCLSRNPSQFALQLSDKTLKQVEKFKYLGMIFTSDGKQNKEIDTGLVKLTQFCVIFFAS